ncbi:hypothetical protein EDD21DRAFT_376229 [Dissophora ornata]|nr:hypothetical protein EDD21DRAFT_376229 [Dissophora ornata]
MARPKKQSASGSNPGKKALGPKSASKVTKSKPGSKPTDSKGTSSSTRTVATRKSAASSSTSLPSIIPRKKESHVLSDEESSAGSEEEEGVEPEPEGHDRQLRLRRTLRVVSNNATKRSWKPMTVKTRTHVQSMVANLFPAAISRARGEKRKIAVQIALNRFMQKVNDRLSELNVPSKQADRVNYSQLSARNKLLEAMLVPDLEHIRDLELRIEQEQILAEKDEEDLESFRQKKKAVDSWTNALHRSKLHPHLRGTELSSTMAGLCAADNDFSHLSEADQRLMEMMPTTREEEFSGADIRDSTYNPDQDLKINKISKRLGNRLSSIERNSEGLDPLMQLLAAAQDRVRELSSTISSTDSKNAATTLSIRHT